MFGADNVVLQGFGVSLPCRDVLGSFFVDGMNFSLIYKSAGVEGEGERKGRERVD